MSSFYRWWLWCVWHFQQSYMTFNVPKPLKWPWIKRSAWCADGTVKPALLWTDTIPWSDYLDEIKQYNLSAFFFFVEEIYIHCDFLFFKSSNILKVMSGKMCCSSSIVQTQKLVDQLRVEASMERLKVCI